MSQVYRKSELYLYRYSADMYRIEILNEKLKEEEMHGDLRVQTMGNEYRSSEHGRGVEDWYMRCEILREKIRKLEGITSCITAVYNELREKSRYQRKYEIMLGILEHVYIMGEKFAGYIKVIGVPERTGYRYRNELVMRVAEELRL